MSVTIDSTNPRIIADNIRKLDDAVQAAASELPEVETTDEGKVLTVNDSGKWAASDLPPYPVGLKDYSTTETATGQKWIDGSEIYQRVYNNLTLQVGNAWVEVGDISGDSVLDVSCLTGAVSSSYYLGRIDNGKLEIYSGRATQTSIDTVIVKYLKAAPSNALNASPDRALNTESELDAAQDPEAEPELKKVTRKKTTTKKEEE